MKHPKSNLLTCAVMVLSTFLCFTCKPDKEPDMLSVSQTELAFAADETQEKPVEIVTNVPVWDYDVSQNWVIPRKSGNNLYVSVQDYTVTSSPRSATITVRAGEAPPVSITVTQSAKEINTLSVSPTSLAFNANDTSEKTVAITTNAPNWDYSNNDSWVRLIKNNNNLTVTVTSTNTSVSERSATVTITAGNAPPVTFRVTQAGTPLSLTVSTSSHTFPSNAGSTSVNVTSNISWTASSNASWLTVSPTSGSNNGSLTMSVTANSSTAQRTGVITVSGSGITQTINVRQDGRTTTTTQPPQVRFRKTSNNASTYEMAVATTGFSELAYYQFGTSTGTTNYFTITAGNHYVLINEGGTVFTMCWNSCTSDTYNFQSNRRYTFEYDGSGYTMIDEGTYTTSNIVANAPLQPKMDVSSKKNVVEGLHSLQDLNR